MSKKTEEPTQHVNGHAALVDDDDENAFDMNLEDLVPEELRHLLDESEKGDEADEPPPQQAKPQNTETDPEADAEVSPPMATLSHDEDDISDDDIDTSPEAIERLLSGDVDAVIRKPSEQEEEPPFWLEDETYKTVRDKFETYGLDPADLNKLVKSVADKYTVDNSKLLEGVQAESSEIKRELDTTRTEMDRLRELERVIRFDHSDEVKEKYLAPINSSINEMQTVLDREGSQVPINKILQAANTTEITKLLQDENLDEAEMRKITGQWRNYKQLATEYSADKEKAKRSLQDVLSANISGETAKKVFTNQLAQLLQKDEKYSYMNERTKDGKLPEHVAKVVTGAKQNFDSLITALNSPQEHVFSEKWLSQLADFVTRATHNDYIQEQYYALLPKYQEQEQALKKLGKYTVKLARAAKGIQGKGGMARKAATSEKAEDATMLDLYNQLLSDPMAIDKLIPEMD